VANRVVFSFIASDRYSAVARKMSAATDRMKRSFRGANAAAGGLNQRVTKLGQKMKQTSVIAGAAAVASAKTFGDMEEGLFNVLTLLDDDAAIQKFEGRLAGLQKESVKMGFSIEDTNKALFDTVSALGANEASFAVFRESQKLAIAGVTDLSVAVDGVTSIMNAYELGAGDAAKVTGSFFTSQKKGKITVAELAANIGKVAPVAKAAGIGYQELLATTAQLTLGGLNAEEATTALKGAISALISPSNEAAKVLRKHEVPMGAAAIQAVGFQKALQALAVAAKKDKDALSEAIPNIRGFTAVASLGEKQIANNAAIMHQMGVDFETGTGLVAAFTKQQGSFNRETARTFGEIKILAAMIGEGLAPVLRVVGIIIRGVIVTLEAFGPVAGKIIAGIIGVLAIAAPILLFFGKFALVMGTIGTTIVAAVTAPVALVAILIAAFIAAVAVILANFDSIKAGAASLVSGVKSFFGFGDDEELNVKAAGELTNRNQTQVDVNLNAPKGTIASVKSKTTGDKGGLALGVNMAEAL